MNKNEHLNALIIEVIDNQIAENDPPETKETLDRLISDGFSEKEAKKLIGTVVSTEIFEVLSNDQEFDLKRFVKALNKLPQMPWD